MGVLQKCLLFHLLTGLGPNALGSEIIHGSKVPNNQMHYMASVQTDKVHKCGGFLIDGGFVVTAAHCNVSKRTSVVLGTHNLKRVQDGSMRYGVKECPNTEYEKANKGNDIKLLKLSRKPRRNNKTQPIRLPPADYKIKGKTKCSVAGWGYTVTGGKVVDVLQKVDVNIIEPKICKEEWRTIKVELPANVICAGGYKTERGFCQGDSGGPLVCGDVAVGVVSFNMRGNCKYPNVPNVYTDLTKYLRWIKKTKKTC